MYGRGFSVQGGRVINATGLFGTKQVFDVALVATLVWLVSCAKPAPPQPPDNSADITSHAFRWQVDTIGAEGSYLYDVCIINDTCAYAVGTLFPRDSSGRSNQGDLHNAAIWNGKTWTMIKVPYLYQGKPIYNSIHAVFGFGPNDIWFGGNGLEHWDGQGFSNEDAVNSFWAGHEMNKMWGSSDNDLYIVGDGGTAVHFDGSWHGITSGTTLPFQDIWGGVAANGQQQVLAIASDRFGLGGKYIVSLSGNSFTQLPDSIATPISLSGIWFIPNQKYYLAGYEIYEKNLLTDPVWQTDLFSYQINKYKFAVRGNGTNDVVEVGENGTVSHYNGSTWRLYSELENTTDRLLSVSIKGDEIVAVGVRNYDGFHYYGVIYHGWR